MRKRFKKSFKGYEWKRCTIWIEATLQNKDKS